MDRRQFVRYSLWFAGGVAMWPTRAPARPPEPVRPAGRIEPRPHGDEIRVMLPRPSA
jgi:hypothetical protein